ncbi:MAG: hypothetical protein O7D32_07865, partial [bacterium]|nr:hypothetical protein [bacterium]
MKRFLGFVLSVTLAVLIAANSTSARKLPNASGLRFTETPARESLPPEIRQSLASPTLSPVATDTFRLAWYGFNNDGIPDAQGWVSVDVTAQLDTFFHVEDATVLDGGQFGRLIVLEGNQSMWCGQAASAVPPFCGYATLPGYGNGWNQSLYSKVFECDSLGLYFEIAWDTEPGYDFVRVAYYEGIGDTWIELTVGTSGFYYDGWGQTIECFMFPTPAGSTQVRFVFTSDGA